MDHFNAFEKRIEFVFKNKPLLWEAMTHRSYKNEDRSWLVPHNERLEFLGDAVIELVVAAYLLKAFPKKPEGELTQIKAALVNAKMLSAVAEELMIANFLLMSRGERNGDPRAKERIFGSAYEALAGAIFSDQGFGSAQTFVKQTLMSRLIDVLAENLHRDSKSVLQEEAQALLSLTPIYKTLEERGLAHARQFIVGVYFNSELIARGEGLSKREAEMAAAKTALESRGWGVIAQRSRKKDDLFDQLVRKAKRT